MSYLQLSFRLQPGTDTDQLTAHLLALGCDSFEEQEVLLLAFIQQSDYQPERFIKCLHDHFTGTVALEAEQLLEDKNWNEEWEKNFPSVIVANTCLVRAPFHPPDPSFPLEIVIEPKMSFGTAHHETTALMMELMLSMAWQGNTVLDMGCGTGILAILAARLGAGEVVAIDNDSWAFANSLENVARNKVSGTVRVLHGEAGSIPNPAYDVLLANINRNILLQDIPVYAAHLNAGGSLLLSGFYAADLPAIQAACDELNLQMLRYLERNNWIAAIFRLQ